ncbi:hypothetical protein CBR_g49681 [Chara braunii]|uniref:Uncharacterized protein n=1 Tax=Chara braunii TaxID=69332 RepID=A0A388M5T4_CHABU|nr:hypothetical protein CBR_g49681 [Chara braunii]|eukprot:GBG89832.1 hypothetical protein CBR_g49681 [Chara braunii]
MQRFKKVNHFQTSSGGQDLFQLNGKERPNRGFNFNMDRAVYDEIEGWTGKNHTIYPRNVADSGASYGVRMPTAASPDPELVADGDAGARRDDDEEGSTRGSSQTTGSPDGFGNRKSTSQQTFEAMTECMEKHGALMASTMESANKRQCSIQGPGFLPSFRGDVIVEGHMEGGWLTALQIPPTVTYKTPSFRWRICGTVVEWTAFSPYCLLLTMYHSRRPPFSPYYRLIAILSPFRRPPKASRHTIAFSLCTILVVHPSRCTIAFSPYCRLLAVYHYRPLSPCYRLLAVVVPAFAATLECVGLGVMSLPSSTSTPLTQGSSTSCAVGGGGLWDQSSLNHCRVLV